MLKEWQGEWEREVLRDDRRTDDGERKIGEDMDVGGGEKRGGSSPRLISCHLSVCLS